MSHAAPQIKPTHAIHPGEILLCENPTVPPPVRVSLPQRERVAHISLVFREMWDSTALSP
jgi:hypothetical protein